MKKSNKLFILALSLLLILSAIGCSSNKDISNNVAVEDMGSSDSFTARPMEESNFEFESKLEPEKVITTIDLNFETTKFDETTTELMKLTEKYKSYVENSNISYNQHYNNKSYKHGYFVIRVPKNDVIKFKSDLNGIGNILSESTNKEDVSKQYRDTESRLRVITTKEERILSLLEKAEKIEDIIALENQLSEIIYEKENLQNSLMNIDDKVDFSTINISIQEVENLRNTETAETTFGTRVSNALKDSIYQFKINLQGIVISIIYLIPSLVILAPLVYLVYWIAKKIRIKRTKKD